VLALDGVHTYYGQSHILQGVSLRAEPGEIVALLGRNGAGKTTTVNTIIGFTPPRRGHIRVNAVEVAGWPPHRIARLGVGLVPQGRGIFPALTVRENVTLAARGGGAGGWTLERVLATFPALAERLGHLGAQLSGGEQQMLAVARALMVNPRLLLLDEPSEGLAPLIVTEIGRIVAALRAEGLAVLLVEQNLSLALSLADRVYVMSKGQIVYEGRPEALQASEDVKHRFLGV
jgi:branched-chain amino acid transport system ATP-binding protein